VEFLLDYRFGLSGENSHLFPPNANNTNKGNKLLRPYHMKPMFLKGLRNTTEYICIAVPTAKQVSISRIRLKNQRGEPESVTCSQSLFFKSSFFSFIFKV